MVKPTLFIGSSTESKWLVSEIYDILSKEDIAVKVWYKGTFYPGDSTLETLSREVLLSEFALLIIYPDDEIIKREETGYTARDNVLFELGLFTGAFGRHRSFYLAVTDKRKGKDKKVLIPSDLSGINRLTDLTLVDSERIFEPDLQSICKELKKDILREKQKIGLSLLPSTSLALGYFNNFLFPVCQALSQKSDFCVGDTKYDLTLGKYVFYIILPNKNPDASQTDFAIYVKKKNFAKVQIESLTPTRVYPFYVDSQPLSDGRLALYDYPTTLSAAWEAVRLVVKNDMNPAEILMVQRREIENFKNALVSHLIKPNQELRFRDNIVPRYLNDLEKDNS
jgi:hypothetical protein